MLAAIRTPLQYSHHPHCRVCRTHIRQSDNTGAINMSRVALVKALIPDSIYSIHITTIHGNEIFVETHTLEAAEEWCRLSAFVPVSKS